MAHDTASSTSAVSVLHNTRTYFGKLSTTTPGGYCTVGHRTRGVQFSIPSPCVQSNAVTWAPSEQRPLRQVMAIREYLSTCIRNPPPVASEHRSPRRLTVHVFPFLAWYRLIVSHIAPGFPLCPVDSRSVLGARNQPSGERIFSSWEPGKSQAVVLRSPT